MSSTQKPTVETSEHNADWTENQLPPVKPPTTGLLMQLFFVPMVIVSIIVGVWLMFGWLAQSGRNPEQLAANLKQLNKGSWQDAHSLSNMLRDPREQKLRHNKELAANLGETLNGLLAEDLSLDSDRQKLAIWLCRALGEFEVDTGLETLLTAIENDDFEVRCSAAEAISTLASGLGTDIKDSNPDLVPRLQTPATERSPSPERDQEIAYGELRSSVGFALGIIGGSEACDTLAMMLSDPYPEARYNAATGLARNGDTRAVPRLCEMLSVDNKEAVRYENESTTLRAWKQNLVIMNGLRAVGLLYKTNKSAVVDESLREAMRTLEASATLGAKDRGKFLLEDVNRALDERVAATEK